MSNTFYSIDDITEYINIKLDKYYVDYLNEEDEENTEDSIEEFLMEYTNFDRSIYLYDFTNLTQKCIFQCLEFIREEYMDKTGDEMDMIYSKEKLEGNLIYFVGQNWGRRENEIITGIKILGEEQLISNNL
jgi:hypothetical protein